MPSGLSPRTITLWKKIEKGYGKPIRRESPQTGYSGFSFVDETGTPIVQLTDGGDIEDLTVHELMHLKLKLEGFPNDFDCDCKCQNDIPLARWLRQNLEDTIEHWIFYPRVVAMGRTPDKEYTDSVKRIVDRGGRLKPAPQVYRLGIEYFRVLTLPNQSDLAKRLGSMYDESGYTEPKETGEQMFKSLISKRPSTPEQELETFAACANELFKGKRKFKNRGLTTHLLGNVRIATMTISIEPLGSCFPTLSQIDTQSSNILLSRR